MALGKKVSPAKFIGMVAAGIGIAQGATQIIGGIQERARLRREMARTKKQFRKNRDTLRNLSFDNPYADIQTNFENPYEDLTVNQQQAQFQAEQAAQSRANILSNLQSAAGPSGIAGLAQTLANQETQQQAAISADIGAQEAANQRLAAQGAVGVQAMEAQAEQQVAQGEDLRKQRERQRTMNIMSLRAGRDEGLANLRQQRAQATQNVVAGIGGVVAGGFGMAGEAGLLTKKPASTTTTTTANATGGNFSGTTRAFNVPYNFNINTGVKPIYMDPNQTRTNTVGFEDSYITPQLNYNMTPVSISQNQPSIFNLNEEQDGN